MCVKKMKKEIQEKYDSIADKQISVGQYLYKVGAKYVHVLNIWDDTSIDKILIEEFYNRYIQ